MTPRLVFLSIPGLRMKDLDRLPNLRAMTAAGAAAPLSPSFPAVTCPVQCNMTTGQRPNRHGVVANGLYLHAGLKQGDAPEPPPSVLKAERDDPCNVLPVWPLAATLPRVEMWTMPNTCVEAAQVWETLRKLGRARCVDETCRTKSPDHAHITSAVWFALLSKFCSADYICNFAPVHHPDGSESPWCYTRPYRFYGELHEKAGHFPVRHYWGPLAGQPASKWITDSAAVGAQKFVPDFFFVYIPRLDYTPQKFGPNAPQLANDLHDLDTLLGELRANFTAAYGEEPTWLVAGEYAMTEVDSVTYPNRVLRELGLLGIEERDGKEYLLPEKSKAFALCDHQFAHVFFNEKDEALVEKAAKRFKNEPNIDEVLYGKEDFQKYDIDHERTGQIVLISKPDAWQAYYFWNDDAKAPDYAGTVDIHRKPGYDPVELFFDRETKSIPLDASLVRGSHGAPVHDAAQKTVLLSSDAALLSAKKEFDDVDVHGIILRFFDVEK